MPIIETPTAPARITDFEIVCPDEATAIQAGQYLGCYKVNDTDPALPGQWLSDGWTSAGDRWSLAVEGHRMTPTGNTVTDPFGNTVPEMVPSAEFYLHGRWWPKDEATPPPSLPAELGVVIQPDDGLHMRFA